MTNSKSQIQHVFSICKLYTQISTCLTIWVIKQNGTMLWEEAVLRNVSMSWNPCERKTEGGAIQGEQELAREGRGNRGHQEKKVDELEQRILTDMNENVIMKLIGLYTRINN